MPSAGGPLHAQRRRRRHPPGRSPTMLCMRFLGDLHAQGEAAQPDRVLATLVHCGILCTLRYRTLGVGYDTKIRYDTDPTIRVTVTHSSLSSPPLYVRSEMVHARGPVHPSSRVEPLSGE